MSTCGGLNISGNETTYTYSSYAVANQGARISNNISTVKSNHPGITAVDAMQIIIDNYFTERMIYYKDETTNWELREGCLSYDIDVEKLLQYERLQKGMLDELAFDSDRVELPVSEGLCYVGKGVQFEYEGKYYNSDEENHALLTQLVQSEQPLKWRWNKELYRKQGGGKDEVSFDAYIVDKSCEKYLSLAFSKRIN